MSYIDSILTKNEKVQKLGILSLWAYANTIFFSFLFLFFSLFILEQARHVDGNINTILLIIAFLFIVASTGNLISVFINYYFTEIAVTDKRVIVKYGFFTTSTRETQLNKIESILVYQSISGRILNYGTVSIIGTGATVDAIKHLRAPHEFKKELDTVLLQQQGR